MTTNTTSRKLTPRHWLQIKTQAVYVRIGSEVMAFTRSGDTSRLRAKGTNKFLHKQGDTGAVVFIKWTNWSNTQISFMTC